MKQELLEKIEELFHREDLVKSQHRLSMLMRFANIIQNPNSDEQSKAQALENIKLISKGVEPRLLTARDRFQSIIKDPASHPDAVKQAEENINLINQGFEPKTIRPVKALKQPKTKDLGGQITRNPKALKIAADKLLTASPEAKVMEAEVASEGRAAAKPSVVKPLSAQAATEPVVTNAPTNPEVAPKTPSSTPGRFESLKYHPDLAMHNVTEELWNKTPPPLRQHFVDFHNEVMSGKHPDYSAKLQSEGKIKKSVQNLSSLIKTIKEHLSAQ